jgi:hypothetical protein
MITPFSQLNLGSVEHVGIEYHVAESTYFLYSKDVASALYSIWSYKK